MGAAPQDICMYIPRLWSMVVGCVLLPRSIAMNPALDPKIIPDWDHAMHQGQTLIQDTRSVSGHARSLLGVHTGRELRSCVR